MKIRSKLCTLMLAITFMPSLALAVQEVFSGIPLLGTEQVPPNDSAGFGAVTAIYDEDTGTLFYEFEWQLEGTNVATAAHFHLGARGESGPVDIDLGTVTGNSGKVSDFRVLDLTQEADLKAGRYYLNVHSDAFPGGEVRGQMVERSPIEGAQVYDPSQARLRLKDVLVPGFGIFDAEMDVVPARQPLSFELDTAEVQ